MSSLPPVKILLVDDLDENLFALVTLLRRDNVELLTARSGREALELLLTHDVALALLDVQMPEMDGFELAELMRGTARTRRVPIIFVTAGARDARRVFRGYDVGAVDFLYKPVDPALLGHKVATFVALHQERLEREHIAAQLEETLRFNEMFVAAVCHDLRTPIANVLMAATLLDAQLTDEAARRTVARMRSSAGRTVAMLEQLEDLARARLGGGLAIDPRPMDLQTLAHAVLEELRLASPEHILRIEYEAGATTGTWDEGRLAQVLQNLVGNAIRHGSRDEGVTVHVGGNDASVTVEVHNGGAIAEEFLPHVFDPFRRRTESVREGLGLGLYIVQEIVRAHGGTIAVTSTRESGTTFRFQLPRAAG
jgi:two-component system, sensor histidine kinase and response regulator